MRKLISIIFATVPFLTVGFPLIAGAQATTITVNGNIPGGGPTSTLPGTIQNFYTFALIISGILAFAVIVYGGVRYAWSSGNPSGESEAKSWITSALLGLLLLAGAYVILQTINPNLVALTSPVMPELGQPATSTAGAPISTTSTCPLTPLSAITDPAALAMESGQTVVWTSSNSDVQKNLTALSTAFQKLKNVLSQPGIKDTVTVNSVYRPYAYQAHLYDIYTHELQLRSNPAAVNISECTPLIAALRSEEQKHGVCYSSGPCLVAQPSGCSPHTKGVGIDLSVSGPVSLSALNPILQANNVGIIWRALPSDPVHFELVNPPFTGCGT